MNSSTPEFGGDSNLKLKLDTKSSLGPSLEKSKDILIFVPIHCSMLQNITMLYV